MSGWAQAISKCPPLTYTTELIRGILGATAPAGRYDLAVLAILGCVYAVIGAVMLRAIERNLRKKVLFSVF
jgi:ABC-type polysaccharide/polyol phosphate export permease